MQPKGTSSLRPEPLNATYLQSFGSRLANKKTREKQSRCKARGPKHKASRHTAVVGLASG